MQAVSVLQGGTGEDGCCGPSDGVQERENGSGEQGSRGKSRGTQRALD